MDCKNCPELNQDKFEKITCESKNHHNLVFFVLNVLLNLKFFGDRICFWENRKECLVCKTNRIYDGYEYDIYENMFNLGFLIEYHSNIFYYLNQLFQSEKKNLCLFNFI